MVTNKSVLEVAMALMDSNEPLRPLGRALWFMRFYLDLAISEHRLRHPGSEPYWLTQGQELLRDIEIKLLPPVCSPSPRATPLVEATAVSPDSQ